MVAKSPQDTKLSIIDLTKRLYKSIPLW